MMKEGKLIAFVPGGFEEVRDCCDKLHNKFISTRHLSHQIGFILYILSIRDS